MEKKTKDLLTVYYNEVQKELYNILNYWMRNTNDVVNGGFIGRIDENNLAFPNAPKGAVLNARILWSFSSAFMLTKNEEHLHLARTAYNYLQAYFLDKDFGGVYWTVDTTGKPLDTKKQVYALAFAIYGCCAYYEASKSEAAKGTAIGLFQAIEQYSFDKTHGGYYEAFARDWTQLLDLRLSEKDANEKKTMNTHLHVLEAYSSLYQVWPDETLKLRINGLLCNFSEHIFNDSTGHLGLFFDETWKAKSSVVSYGHDIESAWLLLKAAGTIESTSDIKTIAGISKKLAISTKEGMDSDGGLWYEYERATDHLVKEKHWWVQAEAMVGFFNNWELTLEQESLDHSINAWDYIKRFMIDSKGGEWFWGRDENGAVMPGQDKVGIWKCPYHNSRACIEILKRINKLTQ